MARADIGGTVTGSTGPEERIASAELLLNQTGTFRLRSAVGGAPAASNGGVFCDLQVGRGWASLTASPAPTSSPADPSSRLAASGFRPPEASGRSPSTRAWFRSWAFPRPADPTPVAGVILGSAREALGLEEGARLAITGGPRPGLRRVVEPIVWLLLALFAGYALVEGWVVLAAWDLLLPGRAHSPAALWAQVAAPLVTAVIALAWSVVWPQIRLRRAVQRRAPTAREVDLYVPGVQVLSFVGPPVILVLLLLVAGG